MDLASRFSLKKKYDVVILSNILECLQNLCQLFAARDNIEKLLKDDGICVCSHVMNTKEGLVHQKEVDIMTMGNLVEEEIDDYFVCPESDKKIEVGYVYKKRQM